MTLGADPAPGYHKPSGPSTGCVMSVLGMIVLLGWILSQWGATERKQKYGASTSTFSLARIRPETLSITLENGDVHEAKKGDLFLWVGEEGDLVRIQVKRDGNPVGASVRRSDVDQCDSTGITHDELGRRVSLTWGFIFSFIACCVVFNWLGCFFCVLDYDWYYYDSIQSQMTNSAYRSSIYGYGDTPEEYARKLAGPNRRYLQRVCLATAVIFFGVVPISLLIPVWIPALILLVTAIYERCTFAYLDRVKERRRLESVRKGIYRNRNL